MEFHPSKLSNPPSRLRSLITAVLLVMSIGLIFGFGWISYNNSSADISEATATSPGTQTASDTHSIEQQVALLNTTARLEQANATINALNSTVISLTAQLNSALATKTAQQNAYDLLAKSNESFKSTYQQDQEKINQIQAELMCDNSGYFKADYGSNASLSNSLKAFIGQIGGNYTFATWDLLWPNSKNAIHRITVRQDNRSFTNVFIAYFDVTDFTSKSVFWVNRGCWLDK